MSKNVNMPEDLTTGVKLDELLDRVFNEIRYTNTKIKYISNPETKKAALSESYEKQFNLIKEALENNKFNIKELTGLCNELINNDTYILNTIKEYENGLIPKDDLNYFIDMPFFRDSYELVEENLIKTLELFIKLGIDPVYSDSHYFYNMILYNVARTGSVKAFKLLLDAIDAEDLKHPENKDDAHGEEFPYLKAANIIDIAEKLKHTEIVELMIARDPINFQAALHAYRNCEEEVSYLTNFNSKHEELTAIESEINSQNDENGNDNLECIGQTEELNIVKNPDTLEGEG